MRIITVASAKGLMFDCEKAPCVVDKLYRQRR
jgi:hypothetical protein